MKSMALLLLLSFPALADEAGQVELLKAVFARPPQEWKAILESRRALLDDGFFQRMSARLQWDAAQGQWWDRRRFAVAGDLALQVVGKPPHFCAEFERSEDQQAWPVICGPQAEHDLQLLLENLSSLAPASSIFQVLDRKPNALEAILKLDSARQARQSHRFAEAERLLRGAMVDDPKLAEAWLEIAELHFTSGRMGLAAREYDQATRLEPHSAAAWLGLGLSRKGEFQENGEFTSWDRACLSLTRCLQLEPNNQLAQSALDDLNARLGTLVARRASSDSGDWQLWIPSRDEMWSLGQGSSSYWRFEEQTLLSLDLTQASGSLVWREERRHSLVWVRSRQPDTRLLFNGLLVGKIGDELEVWTRALGAPPRHFNYGKRRVLICSCSTEDIGLEIEGGRVAGVMLMEKGRLVPELRRLPGFKSVSIWGEVYKHATSASRF